MDKMVQTLPRKKTIDKNNTMKNIYLREINWTSAARNIFFLLRKDIKELFIEQRQITTYNSILLSSILSEEYRKKYDKEINNLLKLGRYTTYPSQDIALMNVQAFYDEKKKMPYVMHVGKKLFFPHNYSLHDAAKCYMGYIYGDCFLGEAPNGAPHQYQSSDFCVKDGDVVVDVGSAEGLFGLDVIETVSKIYLIERDPKWIKALKATFEPYSDKVVFINKLIADKDSRKTITLGTLLKNEINVSLFIKMDIEGYEVSVVKSGHDFLEQNMDICLSCCTYHHNDDAFELERQFNDLGYATEYSNGYMLFARYDQPVYPYFRRGLIRAKKNKSE